VHTNSSTFNVARWKKRNSTALSLMAYPFLFFLKWKDKHLRTSLERESETMHHHTTMIASSTGKDQKQKHAIQQNKHHRRISTILTIVLKWF